MDEWMDELYPNVFDVSSESNKLDLKFLARFYNIIQNNIQHRDQRAGLVCIERTRITNFYKSEQVR